MLLLRSCRTLLLRQQQLAAHRPHCLLPRPTSAPQQQVHNSSLLLQGASSLQLCNAKAKGEGGGPKLKYDLKPVTKDDVEVTYSRSSGAGGQNVNKLSTKADVRFDLNKQSWIPDEVKDAIRQALALTAVVCALFPGEESVYQGWCASHELATLQDTSVSISKSIGFTGMKRDSRSCRCASG
eukprot:47202-Pelagomonas_calceolata.AAC.2